MTTGIRHAMIMVMTSGEHDIDDGGNDEQRMMSTTMTKDDDDDECMSKYNIGDDASDCENYEDDYPDNDYNDDQMML